MAVPIRPARRGRFDAVRRCAGAAGLVLALSLAAPLCAQATGQSIAAAIYPGGKWRPGPPAYGAVVTDEVPVTMDDGVVLRASIAYPTDLATGKRAAGRFPVIIEHTPYVKLGAPIAPLTYFTERGYIVALVRARGTGTSGGEVAYSSPRDGEDGKAIVDWAAHRLEGSDGRLALIGCSYPGGIALTDAAHLGPNSPVKAVVAACNGFHSQNRGTMMRAGLMNSNMRTMAERLIPYVGSTPSTTSFFTEQSGNIKAGGDIAYDGAFWRDRLSTDLAGNIVASGIPVLLWSGWQDRVEGAVRTYTALQNVQAGRPATAPMVAGQKVSPRYQLIQGDWGHAAGLDLGIYLEWIETWLKGVDTGIQATATPMHMFETGTDRWINLAHFPSVAADTPAYLAAAGVLAAAAPRQSGSEQLIRQEPDLPGGKLSFMTPPVAEGMTLSGAISATIYASSSNTNLELVARLFDVAADGKATEITLGAVLGSLHTLDREKSWTDARGAIVWPWPKLDRDEYLKPGQVYRLDIEMLSRQWGIAPGHRLRLELSGQSPAALCSAGPNSPPSRTKGMDPCDLTATQQKSVPGGRYTIRYGGRYPSAVNLPQMAWMAFPTVRSAALPTAYSENMRRLEPSNLTMPIDWGSDR